MAVEIFILTGARQGERAVFDVWGFGAGGEPDCALFFDPRADAGAANRSVWFRLTEDGWHVVRTNGTVFINQQVIAGPTRIRSGDVVRMSEHGPDFSFTIVARAAAPWPSPRESYRPPSAAPASPWAMPVETGPGQASPLGSRPAVVSAMKPAEAPTPLPTAPISAATVTAPVAPQPRPAASAAVKQRWPLVVGGGVVICALLGIMLVLLMHGRTTVVMPPTPPTPTAATSAPLTRTPSAPPLPPPPSVSREDQIAAQLKDAVFLVQVESSDRFWPFVTCCAVGEHTLLTSALEACHLLKWREDPKFGFKFWVIRPSSDIKMAVQEIRIQAPFLKTLAEKKKPEEMTLTDQGRPRDLLYFDLALLTVAEKLPKIASLASPKEVEEGLPLYCCGFVHEGKKITKFDSPQFKVTPAKLDLVFDWPDAELRARVLHVTGRIPRYAHGSPLVNEAGKVLGVYGQSALPEDDSPNFSGQGQKDLHYAPSVNPELISLGLGQGASKMWLVPASRKSGADAQENR